MRGGAGGRVSSSRWNSRALGSHSNTGLPWRGKKKKKNFETEIWRVTAVGPGHVFHSPGTSKTVWEESEDTCWSGVASPLVPTAYAASTPTCPLEQIRCLPSSLSCGHSGHFQCLLRERSVEALRVERI